jgi:hypothetical protein
VCFILNENLFNIYFDLWQVFINYVYPHVG